MNSICIFPLHQDFHNDKHASKSDVLHTYKAWNTDLLGCIIVSNGMNDVLIVCRMIPFVLNFLLAIGLVLDPQLKLISFLPYTPHACIS